MCSRPEKQYYRRLVAEEEMKGLVWQEQQEQIVGNGVREITEDLLMFEDLYCNRLDYCSLVSATSSGGQFFFLLDIMCIAM